MATMVPAASSPSPPAADRRTRIIWFAGVSDHMLLSFPLTITCSMIKLLTSENNDME